MPRNRTPQIYRRHTKRDGDVWYLKVWLRDGRTKSIPTRKTAVDGANSVWAKRKAFEIQAQIDAGHDPFFDQRTGGFDIVAAAEGYKNRFYSDWRGNTLENVSLSLRKFIDYFERSGLQSIDDQMIIRFRDQLMATLSPATVNQHLRNVRAFLRRMPNPPQHWTPPRIEMVREDVGPPDFFSDSELDKIFAAAEAITLNGQRLGDVARVATWTGMRRRELICFNWEWVELDLAKKEHLRRPYVIVPQLVSKSKWPRVIPVRDAFRAWLDERYNSSSGRLFPTLTTEVSHSFHDLLVALKIYAPNVREVSLHSFRDTFAVQMIRMGVSLAALARIMGHYSTKVTERYYLNFDARELTETVHRAEKIYQESTTILNG